MGKSYSESVGKFGKRSLTPVQGLVKYWGPKSAFQPSDKSFLPDLLRKLLAKSWQSFQSFQRLIRIKIDVLFPRLLLLRKPTSPRSSVWTG